MMGCPVYEDPVAGGISAFGPANTAVLGVNRPALGRDDVTHLIDFYLAAFVQERSLSVDDQERLSAYLWKAAEPEIDPGATAVLSRCKGDAGVDVQGMDAGGSDGGI
jgi:hypothetical protein